MSIADGFTTLLQELEELDQPDDAKAAFRELVIARMEAALTVPEQRVLFARHLLDRKEPRHLVSERLKARYGIEHAQSHRDISKALQSYLPDDRRLRFNGS
ncbi:hypothetical protein CR105_03045 [Massilia eurypsychrophila]|uniref:Uncharacterized protein n=1 Tax=Massilia eurypsychrophila TaxID=1485217 RepID=A0A2G8TJ72_9BURK|nr:hypothetical protein [Massilia eurypsychrophila]PIL46083.1 hypothetical protein CR105_03045 [Massilia eurypsychrophila]